MRRESITISFVGKLTLFCVLIGLGGGCEPPAITDNGVVGVFGSVGLGPGAFSYPRAIASDAQGSVYVVDKSGRIQRFGSDGAFEHSWTMPETEAGKPVGISVHPDGRIFVADTHYHRVVVFDRDGNQLGAFGRQGRGDGEFLLPTDVAFDEAGFIYVSEYGGNDRISKWTAGFEFVGAFADSEIDGVRINRPAAIVVDRDQTIWVADACNHRLLRLTLDGKHLLTVGKFGSRPGELRYPYDLSISKDRRIMVCEYEGNRLQWFDTKGRSLETWGRSGRDPGELSGPWGATYGADGRVYIVDSMNSRIQIVRP